MSAQTYKDIRITWVFYQIEQVYLVTWTRHIRFAEFALRWVSGIISCDLKLYAICRVPRNARSRIMGILHSHRSDSWLRFRFRSVLGGAFFDCWTKERLRVRFAERVRELLYRKNYANTWEPFWPFLWISNIIIKIEAQLVKLSLRLKSRLFAKLYSRFIARTVRGGNGEDYDSGPLKSS